MRVCLETGKNRKNTHCITMSSPQYSSWFMKREEHSTLHCCISHTFPHPPCRKSLFTYVFRAGIGGNRYISEIFERNRKHPATMRRVRPGGSRGHNFGTASPNVSCLYFSKTYLYFIMTFIKAFFSTHRWSKSLLHVYSQLVFSLQ